MYSAESIIDALKANKELNCEDIDTIGCPSPLPHDGCNSDPDNCDLCKNQLCKQRVSIHQNFKRLTVLTFRFMVSPQNHGGFIHKDDSALTRLIKHNYLNKALLRSVG